MITPLELALPKISSDHLIAREPQTRPLPIEPLHKTMSVNVPSVSVVEDAQPNNLPAIGLHVREAAAILKDWFKE